ncbi:putative phosphatase regulatory subunit-domain-containing protein [Lactarius quietus]|nr:putative phosphatase regulatory subunit-domain-containing protein [Lactarius quietus]
MKLSSFSLPKSKCDLQLHHRPPHRLVAPLKSSLKYSRSCRATSEPSTPPTRSPASHSPPPTPKNVRFRGEDSELESICLFRSTGRPSSISNPRSHSDTETETDADSLFAAQQFGGTICTKVDMSPIPSPHTPPESNVRLETLTLLPALPPLLRGIVRVRNISFEKCVAARFTTDDWTTISEAHACYISPAPDEGVGAWDRFAFTIPVPTPRTILLAVRYTVPSAGEWWDNNGGADFRVVLAATTPPRPAPATLALAWLWRPNTAVAKTYAYPMLPQYSGSPVVPPPASQRLRVP